MKSFCQQPSPTCAKCRIVFWR